MPEYPDPTAPSAVAAEPLATPEASGRARVPEAGDRESLIGLVRDIPNFGRLLYGLARDPRVSSVDKGIVIATIGYLLMPLDLIPDFIPFLGQLDDIYLLALAVDRLMNNSGMDVLLDHWHGDPSSLEMLLGALDKAGSFLPEPVRRLLHRRMG